ncbi:hypothetical protein A1O7_05743 [Cladophialophora yegresii CBS 114405]|uniref:Uncharacterized protein n=1 Tax=Cladophialophora yegresii CBS 114405 TaxID=1182544 RepID=W9VRY5_9EURO|nr:uncharacterized protein A1O7_05743 [Cladophialophora yegresii CBS 114405]EXJ58318.1 hypothetical protein A1O7_05743 [Cladophialophora yegresii CBS 114405]
MDEPFRKRPRLSMFPSDDQLDEDLGGRRKRNDLLLKSRFESIFEKYSHDFSSIGDEIDMDSMTIVVNNGHLQSMENETDPGGLHNERGQTLLRAMTETINDDDEVRYHNPDADEVMNSIEEMAESAAMAEDQEEMVPMDSDEELFLPVHARPSYMTPPESTESQNTIQSDLTNSDHDSLFEAPRPRHSSSPDSLFESKLESGDSDATELHRDYTSMDGDVDDNAILQKFGPQVGREVLSVIQRARNAAYQAHIEPAWRIPANVALLEQAKPNSTSRTPPSTIFAAPEIQRSGSPDHSKSLWKGSRFRSTRRAVHQARAIRRIRAESEDPLQEDFNDVEEEDQTGSSDEDRSDWGDQETPKQKRKKVKVDEQVLQMREATCYYCQRHWSTRTGMFNHWTKLATRFDKGELDEDDVHDLEYIHAYVANSKRAPKGPRLIVSDFKTLVELHEGAGISFDEIAELRALRTRKTGIALNDVYDRYRLMTDNSPSESADWSKQELQTLHQLCQNPKRDMSGFASQFENRNNTDIGNKLAEIWLAELINSGQVDAKAVQEQKTSMYDGIDGDRSKHRRRALSVDELFIKQEPGSDEELFGQS